MAKFFIERPIFAIVLALFVLVFGSVAITQLPVAQYPPVAPPTIVLNATYPGASAKTMDEAVISVIEQELNGSPGMIYMESVSQSNGTGSITVSYEPGTSPDLAQVDVQNRLSRAAPRLPSAVTQQGVRVDKARSNFLLFTILSSDNPAYDPVALGDYASRNVLPEIQRIPGVGQAQLFGTERAMRIWVDPAKLVGYKLSMSDVTAAISAQNAQVSAGAVGDIPNLQSQGITATVVVQGQLASIEQFGAIVLRANADGSSVRLRDVARIELGAQTYATSARLDGQPSTGIGVQLSPTGNALATAEAIKTRMGQLSKYFPEGVKYSIPYDSSRFIKISISQVVETLLEAVALVFVVMFVFLQDWRYTLIPTIVVPVALLGTFAVLLALGYSINVLTMFGMVLVIGIVVDDAIVVVENVERIMSSEGLPPLEATRKAMGQIQGAIVGVTVVLISVFVPLAFFGGAVGNIYRQFSTVMVASIAFSAFMALSLTPALCGMLLKPVEAGHHHAKGGFFGLFNRNFEKVAHGYEGMVGKALGRTGRRVMIMLFALIVGGVVLFFAKLPASFQPGEDQGYLIVNVQLPPGATRNRTLDVMKQVEAYVLKQVEAGHQHAKTGFFGWFNRGFSRTAKGYESVVARILRRAARYLVIYAAIIGAVVVVYRQLPTSFLPQEDQGYIIVNVQLPPGATQERMLSVIKQVEGYILKQPEVQSMVGVLGFSFSGQGQNAGLAFTTLKDWEERKDPAHSAESLAGRAFGALLSARDAFIYPLSPPPIPELGTASGFTFRLQDRSGAGHEALINARNQLLGMASKSPILTQVRPDGFQHPLRASERQR